MSAGQAVDGKSGAGTDVGALFYDDLIANYVDAAGTVARPWLLNAVRDRLLRPACRFVLLIGEPGAGKTGVMAALARANPDWLRYFIRADSTTPLSSGDAVSVMLRVGMQLAHRRPEIFDPALLEISVAQRVEQAGPGASVIGVKIEDLKVSPFYRTAIRVQQDVQSLSGGLTAVQIAQATLEPRLLEIATLSHLALLEPAAALARRQPDQTIVVLIDALDELVALHGTNDVLYWLETFGDVPPNLRFVLSSRPHDRLRTIVGTRGPALESIEIKAESNEVTADVRSFSVQLFDETRALERQPATDRETAVRSLCAAARGNFAYLTAYARSLRVAVQAGQTNVLDELLKFESLPGGLYALYAAFVRRIRGQIESMGRLEVAAPRDKGDELIGAWEGVGKRMLAVLAVARAPLSLQQMMDLGAIRVWKSAAANVLQSFVPFLDDTDQGWQLFHPSVGEFLTTADQREFSDVLVDAREWNTRIVRHYQGDAAWNAVGWRALDDYGLLHTIDHLASVTTDPTVVTELVTSGLRTAMKERFQSDLPFRRILEIGRAGAATLTGLQARLAEGIFLELVSAGLSAGAATLDPAVFGLMARLGHVKTALARAELMRPGLRKYRSFEAIWQMTPPELREQLGPLDGVEHLVGVALEVPDTETAMVGYLGMDRDQCLTGAAVAMAPHDRERALRLVDLIGPRGFPDRGRAAMRAAASGDDSTAPDAETDDGGSGDTTPVRRLQEVTRALAAGGVDTQSSSGLVTELTSIVKQLRRKKPSFSEWGPSVVHAAETLQPTHPDLAAKVLAACDPREVDSANVWAVVSAARVWASWDRPVESRRLLEKALVFYRGLNWYGPARDIARVAVIASRFDRAWGEQLADEAVAMVMPVIEKADTFELGRLSGTIAGMVDAFRPWDRERALRLARRQRGGWIHGAEWDSAEGRTGALAVIGLDAAIDDPTLAAQLLTESLADEDAGVRFGQSTPYRSLTELFVPEELTADGDDDVLRSANFHTYIVNEVNYWSNGREWRFFSSPADVLRSLEFAFFPRASWAQAVAAAIAPLAALDAGRAAALTFRTSHPCDRLVALAGLAATIDAAQDARADAVLAAIRATERSLPEFAAATTLPPAQQPVLVYLDPTVRARFEAAVLLPDVALGESMVQSTGSWYVPMVWQAEKIVRDLEAASAAELDVWARHDDLELVLKDMENADDLVASLVRFGLAAALARADVLRAREAAWKIVHPSIRMMAELCCLAFESTSDGGLVDRSLRALEASADKIVPHHRAELAGIAAQYGAEKGLDVAPLIDFGLNALVGNDPAFAVHGLIGLAAGAPPPQDVPLLSRALELSKHIGNEYLRDDALADLLGHAIAAGDVRLTMEVVTRAIHAGWRTFVEALRRAMPDLVKVLGPDAVDVLDAALRRAQAVLGAESAAGTPPEDLDGVSPARSDDEDAALRLPAWMEPDPAYMAMYLDEDDVGPAMKRVQDSRLDGPDPGDEPFERHHGRNTGLVVWLADADQAVWRMVDVRFVFPSAAEAAAYHEERLAYNSEGQDVVTGAPAVGEDCHVFGGTREITMGTFTTPMTTYFYIFRIGSVVVKLFVAQGMESSEPLTPARVFAIAEKIVARIDRSRSPSTPSLP